MVINFLCNPVHTYGKEGWEPWDTRLSGTEESVVAWANELSSRGHEVKVYKNGQKMYLQENGPDYFDREAYGNHLADICINIKSSDIAPKEPTLYLTNEFNATDLDLSQYLGVIWPSQWAVDNIPVNNQTFILPHGYDEKNIYPKEKINKQCFYASSPDRGLEILLEAWPKVHVSHPDATLIVTYDGNIDLPNVMNMGDVDEEMMNEIYRTSDIWCHPCTGGELYCMTGKKAQVAGCIPVIIPTMALLETVERGFKTDREHYAQALIEVLDMPFEARNTIRQDIIKHANAVSWEQSTDQLLAIIESVLDT